MKEDVLTEKGLFERLIRLETKLDMIDEKNNKSDKKFSRLVWIIIGIEAANFIWNWLLYIHK